MHAARPSWGPLDPLEEVHLNMRRCLQDTRCYGYCCNHNLNFSPEDINYYLLNNKLPFSSYSELREHLKKYYSTPKDVYYSTFKKDSEDAHNYLLGRDRVMVLEEPVGYNVYTNEPIDLEEEKNMKAK